MFIKMQLINLTNKSQLNDFVGSLPLSQFLQSFEWGEFQEKVAGKIFRIAIEEQDELIAVATLIKRTLPMGKSYFYCPRGPIINIKDKKCQLSWHPAKCGIVAKATKIKDILEFLFGEIKIIAKQEKVMFLRFEPNFQFPRPPCSRLLRLAKPSGQVAKRSGQAIFNFKNH